VSFKTDRLVALFPEVYAARERDALLHRLLDGLAAELMHADAAVKDLLKSHWIDYTKGGGLDGLGALLGVARRLLPDGTPEGDDTFRPLIKATVPSFIGGGTVEAIKGAVRAALGLPYDLALLQKRLAGPGGNVTPGIADLVAGFAALVRVEEFSPKTEVVLGNAVPAATGSTAAIDVNFASIQPLPPRIVWTFTRGSGRNLSLVRQDTGAGIMSKGEVAVPEGSELVLAGAGTANFSASIGTANLTSWFVDVDGTSPPALPPIPAGSSKFIFSAKQAAQFDRSHFDRNETFDAAVFSVRMEWTRFQPLMFDVVVPYFVDAAVARILAGTGHEGRFKLFKGLSHDAIQRVVDASRAAGVRGMVQYSLSLPGESTERTPWEDQNAADALSALGEDHHRETHDADERLAVGALDSAAEVHDAGEHFAIGGVFNVSVFDGSFGFQ
jgi:hypothetical protein